MPGLTHFEQCSGRCLIVAVNQETMRLAHIDSVRNGKACDCLCPGCHEPLIAVHPTENIRSHFRHTPEPGSSQPGICHHPEQIFETMTHLAAKEYLATHKELTLPAYYHRQTPDNDGCHYESFRVFPQKKVQFDRVELESSEKTYRPDCIGYWDGSKLLIEVYVSHPVDAEKLDKIKKDKTAAIEICLNSTSTECQKDQIRQLLATPKYIRWLNCPAGDTQEKKTYSQRFFKAQRRQWEKQQLDIRNNCRRKARSLIVQQLVEELMVKEKERVKRLIELETMKQCQDQEKKVHSVATKIEELIQEIEGILEIKDKNTCPAMPLGLSLSEDIKGLIKGYRQSKKCKLRGKYYEASYVDVQKLVQSEVPDIDSDYWLYVDEELRLEQHH